MSVVFRIFLTVNSLLFSLLVFFVKNEITINSWHSYFYSFPNLASYVLYFLLIMVFTRVSIKLAEFLGSDSIDKGSLSAIEPVNDRFLPSYLGYFFVALSIPTFKIFFIVFAIIAIFIYSSRVSYFNPMFFILKFNFYFVVNSKNIKILLITKKQLKDPATASFNNLKRINNYTFIDIE